MYDTIFTDKILKSESQKDKNKEEENENENEDDYYDYENQNKTISQNKIIKGKNDLLDEMTDKSKSFEEQIKSLKKREDRKDKELMIKS